MSHSQTAARVGSGPAEDSSFWLSSLVSHQTSEAAASLLAQFSVTEKPWCPDQPVRLPLDPFGGAFTPTLPATLEVFGSLKKPAQPGQSRLIAIVPEAKPWPRSSHR